MQTMESIFTNLKNTFRAGNILAKLIYINVGLFILIRLMGVIFLLFNIPGISFLQYLQMPSSPATIGVFAAVATLSMIPVLDAAVLSVGM